MGSPETSTPVEKAPGWGQALGVPVAGAAIWFGIETLWYSDWVALLFFLSIPLAGIGLLAAILCICRARTRRQAVGFVLASLMLMSPIAVPEPREAMLRMRHHLQFAATKARYLQEISRSSATLREKREWPWGSRNGQGISLIYDPSDRIANEVWDPPCRLIITKVSGHFYVRDDACP